MILEYDLASKNTVIAGAGGSIDTATSRLVSDMGTQVRLSELNVPNAIANWL